MVTLFMPFGPYAPIKSQTAYQESKYVQQTQESSKLCCLTLSQLGLHHGYSKCI
jgi:hypothetical protein